MSWYRTISDDERKTFWACFGGWALDAFDIQLFSLVIPTLLGIWHISKGDAGLVTSLTLVTSAVGGWVGGAIADRIGRVKALQIMILWFALMTFASAFAQSFGQLLVLKGLQGLGFGGEWATGVALLSEAIRPAHRGKALGTVQGAWAVGWGAAVILQTLVYLFVPPEIAWRALFAVGLLPALLVIYVRRQVPEPDSSPIRTPLRKQGERGRRSSASSRPTCCG